MPGLATQDKLNRLALVRVKSVNRVATVREKRKFFKVRVKSGNFAKGQGKSQFLSKSVKSQGIYPLAVQSVHYRGAQVPQR